LARIERQCEVGVAIAMVNEDAAHHAVHGHTWCLNNQPQRSVHPGARIARMATAAPERGRGLAGVGRCPRRCGHRNGRAPRGRRGVA
jgi:hypothetical protein